jgi:predicted ATP-grasp superfamily ATP-dependent carboligase
VSTDGDHEARQSFPWPPVLLLTPAYYGTLAAVRAFGRAGIPVTTAGPTPWNVSAFSKYAARSELAPDTSDSDALLRWLEAFAAENERHVLLSTCDDTAWLFARHRERLSQLFYLSSPTIETVHGLLHKGKLAEHARASGLDTPKSWQLRSSEDLSRVAQEAEFPLLLKPTTQALFPARSKGRLARDASELVSVFESLAALDHGSELEEYDPSCKLPMVQEFFPDASRAIYGISGFVHDGKLCSARAAVKVLQRPRQLGVGVCFEEAPLDEGLRQGLERLAQRVGYTGVFEAEFVRSGERDVLIDFNPRFYNQMGFDVARGLPLPLLAYGEALRGSRSDLPSCNEVSADVRSGKVFVYTSAFKVMIASQRLSGALSAEEAETWLNWLGDNRDNRVDAVADPDDVWPGRLDTLRMVHHHLRHPRAFLRSIVLNR